MFFRDPLYGDIYVEKDFENIIHSALFRRLMYISQPGGKQWVFPSANYTRFEHSIGTYHLAKIVSKTLKCRSGGGVLRKASEEFKYVGIDFEKHMEALKTVALLHDIGHLPFSHTLEFALNFFGYKTVEILDKKFESRKLHERLGYAYLTDPSFREEALKLSNLIDDFPELKEDLLDDLLSYTLGGKKESTSEILYLKEILDGFIDIDRIDHLSRDVYFTGVPVFTTDPISFISSYVLLWDEKLEGYQLSIDRSALAYVMGMLVGRELLYESVYSHPKTRALEMMLSRAFNRVYEREKTFLSEIILLDDRMFLIKLKNELEKFEDRVGLKFLNDLLSGYIYNLAVEMRYPQVYGVAVETGEFGIINEIFSEYDSWEKIRDLEEAMTEKLKIKEGELFIYRDHTTEDPRKILKLHKISELIVYDRAIDSYALLSDFIPWVDKVIESWRDRWCIRVYVRNKKIINDVIKVSKSVLPGFEKVLEYIERHKAGNPRYIR